MKRSETKKISVGIIGCGTIGSCLADALKTRFRPFVGRIDLCDHHPENAARLKKVLGLRGRIVSLKELVRNSDLIIEAASQKAVREILGQKIGRGKTLFVMSVGGLVQAPGLERFLKKSNARMIVPSGAVAGVDGLLGARESGLQSVVLATRKPPDGLKEAPYFRRRKFPPLQGREEKRLFRGTALRAIRAFPQNINVAALLSLAGLGPEKTFVEIWTSRVYRFNRHEIEIRYRHGRIRVELENRPAPRNPKTSALAIYSAIAALRQFFSSFRTGT